MLLTLETGNYSKRDYGTAAMNCTLWGTFNKLIELLLLGRER